MKYLFDKFVEIMEEEQIDGTGLQVDDIRRGFVAAPNDLFDWIVSLTIGGRAREKLAQRALLMSCASLQ